MAYGCMLYELTGISVKKLVIIMSCENGECIVYEEYNKAKYIKLLGEYIRKFVKQERKKEMPLGRSSPRISLERRARPCLMLRQALCSRQPS